MRTLAFILFAAVTAAAAALSTLVASRYLGLEKELSEARAHIESISMERKRQEEEKIAMRLERERIQADLEARLAEQKNQLDDCANLRQNELGEVRAGILNLNKRLTDMQVQASPSAYREEKAPEPQATDVPKGAIPTPAQEAKTLEKAQ